MVTSPIQSPPPETTLLLVRDEDLLKFFISVVRRFNLIKQDEDLAIIKYEDEN